MAEVKQFLAAKKWRQAIDKLTQAEESAASASDSVRALDIALAIAAVHEKLNERVLAADVLFRASQSYSNVPKAVDAAMMSVWNIDPNTPESVYRERLSTIVDSWPGTSQAATAASSLERAMLSADMWLDCVRLWSKRLDQLEGSARTRDQAFARYALLTVATLDSWFDRKDLSEQEFAELHKALGDLKQKIIRNADAADKQTWEVVSDSLRQCDRWPSLNTFAALAIEPVPSTAASWLLESSDQKLDNRIIQADPLISLGLHWARVELLFQQVIYTSTHSRLELNMVQKLGTRLEQLKSTIPVSKDSDGLEEVFGKGLAEKLRRSLSLYQSAIKCWSGDEASGLAEMAAARNAEVRNAWWPYRMARIQQTLPSQREQAITLFRTLANGFPAGIDPWLESRARTVETMLMMGNRKAAQELSDLLLATYPTMSAEWQAKFKP